MGEVFVIDDEEEVVEKKIEVLEKVVVFFGRSRWRGSNRDCCRNLRSSTRSNHSGSRSRGGQAFGTLVYGIGVFGGGVFMVFWFFRQLWQAGCLSWVYGWLSVVLGAYTKRVIRRMMKAITTALVTMRVTSIIVWFMYDDVVGLRCRREG